MTDTRYCAIEVKNCTKCGGEGSIPADWRAVGPPVTYKCPVCKGKGEIWTPVPLEKALKELGYTTFQDLARYMLEGEPNE